MKDWTPVYGIKTTWAGSELLSTLQSARMLIYAGDAIESGFLTFRKIPVNKLQKVV